MAPETQTNRPIPVGSILLCFIYVVARVFAYWRNWHSAFVEIALQLFILLPAILIGLRPASSPSRLFRIPTAVLVSAVVLFVVGAWAVNGRYVRGRIGGDERAYLFQGKILASGHFWVPAPPVPIFFNNQIISDGRWLAKFPPGYPLVLGLASSVGLETGANILFGTLLLWLTFLTGRLVYSDAEARLAVLLLVASPFFVIDCLALLSHPFCGCLLATAVLFYFRTVRRNEALWNVAVMLLCIAAAICVRPLTGAVFGVILGPATLFHFRHRPRRMLQIMALCGAFAVLTIAVNGFYNLATTGIFTRFPYAVYTRTAVPVEIQPTLYSLFQNMKLGPSDTWACLFPLLPIAAAFAVWRDREERHDTLLLALLGISLVISYAPNPLGWGTYGGNRFYFESLSAVALLGARGIRILQERYDAARRIVWYVGPLAATSVAVVLLTLPRMNELADPYVEVRRAIESVPAIPNSVVFMVPNEPDFYAHHFNLNDPDWRSEPVFYAPDPGPAERETFVRALGRGSWRTVSYDPASRRATLSEALRPR